MNNNYGGTSRLPAVVTCSLSLSTCAGTTHTSTCVLGALLICYHFKNAQCAFCTLLDMLREYIKQPKNVITNWNVHFLSTMQSNTRRKQHINLYIRQCVAHQATPTCVSCVLCALFVFFNWLEDLGPYAPQLPASVKGFGSDQALSRSQWAFSPLLK